MIDDVMNRGKVKRGSDLPQSKLTEQDVRNIRALEIERREIDRRRHALTNEAIAEKFGVHPRTIEKVLSREGWCHV